MDKYTFASVLLLICFVMIPKGVNSGKAAAERHEISGVDWNIISPIFDQ